MVAAVTLQAVMHISSSSPPSLLLSLSLFSHSTYYVLCCIHIFFTYALVATMYMHVLILLCYTCTITHAEKQTGGNQDEGSPNVRETANGNGNENNPTISIEEELRYATRFEGYDIPDPKYETWLRLNHPNVVSSNPSVTILQTTPSSSSASFSSPSSSQHMPSISQASTKPNVPHKRPSATPCRSNQVSKSRRSPLSDLLNLPVQPNVKAKTGKARVLTSSECLCLLLEKE